MPRLAGDWTQSFMDRVDVRGPSDCWPWIGVVGPKGYGNFMRRVAGRPTSAPAHRIAYELLVGPIPAGLHLDHICHDSAVCDAGDRCPHRRCCNPEHLAAVSPAENSRRAGPALSRSSVNRAKRTCPLGHPYEGDNVVIYDGKRYCRACRDQRNRSRRRSAVEVAGEGRTRNSERHELLLCLRKFGNSTVPSDEPAFGRRGRPRKQHCKWGHPLVVPNLTRLGNGSRRCRACHLRLPSMAEILAPALVAGSSTERGHRLMGGSEVEGSTRTAGRRGTSPTAGPNARSSPSS